MRRKNVKKMMDFGTKRHVSACAGKRNIALLDFIGSLHSAGK
jgi:hypothetical protein